MKSEYLFFIPHLAEGLAHFPEEEARHCIKVLRHQSGDTLQATDGVGNLYWGTLEVLGKTECRLHTERIIPSTAAARSILNLAIVPTKHQDRMEWMVEKATELGVRSITLLSTRHQEDTHLRMERLHKVAVSAMKQSQQAWLPELKMETDFNSFIRQADELQRFIAHCRETPRAILLKAFEQALPTLLLIGPEGDFSTEEIAQAESEGFVSVSLGNTRLRTETAAIAALAVMNAKMSLLCLPTPSLTL